MVFLCNCGCVGVIVRILMCLPADLYIVWRMCDDTIRCECSSILRVYMCTLECRLSSSKLNL